MPATTIQLTPTKQPILLIVDDNPINLEILAEIFHQDYTIKVATNGPDALQLSQRSPQPDLILLDVMMPGMDGYEVCAALKQDPATQHIPVIFVTAKTAAESEMQALAKGAVDFLHKPINLAVAQARVRLHLDLAQHRCRLEDLVQARTQELAAARDAAESANRAKSAFLANMSHELRTPLHQILSFASMLLRPGMGEPSEARTHDRLEKITQATRRLLTLVEGLLDLARLESAWIQLHPQPFAPRLLLDQVQAKYREVAQTKQLEVVQDIDPQLPTRLRGDPLRLDQILGYLLDNALKFSKQGRITLRVCLEARQREQCRVRFEVEDHGIGISPEMQLGLFQSFHQGDNSSTRYYGGAGLGLVLSQRLVALMGGEIILVSVANQGTTAGFCIPLGVFEHPMP